MIRSMTGFGRGSASEASWAVEAILKAVNHRYLELRIRGLEGREELEIRTRRQLLSSFCRGRVDLTVELEHRGEEGLVLDLQTARRYHQGLEGLCDVLGLEGGVRMSDLIALGALRFREPEEELWPPLKRAVEEAIAHAQAMRDREGEHLRRELEGHLVGLEELVERIEDRAPRVKLYYKERLRERARELLESELEEERLEEEAVLFAERSDITEELARLRSHLAAARSALDANGPAGRMLDFLAQEMVREANTISAKAREGEILRRTVAMRAEIEKIREQVRNVE